MILEITTNSTISILALIVSSGVIPFLLIIIFKLGGMNMKIDTLWDAYKKNGEIEYLKAQLGTRNSPVKSSDESKKLLEKFEGDLKDFYKKQDPKISDSNLAFKIQRHFGERLFEEVCIPELLMPNACLLIAVELCRLP